MSFQSKHRRVILIIIIIILILCSVSFEIILNIHDREQNVRMNFRRHVAYLVKTIQNLYSKTFNLYSL